MRQAAESEIIQLSMKVRNGEDIPYMRGKEVQVLPKSDLSEGMLKWADVIICATNKTRESINKRMRGIYGYEGSPKVGEKIICLRNYWDNINFNNDPLVNGLIGCITEVKEKDLIPPGYAKCPLKKIECYDLSFTPEGEEDEDTEFTNIEVDKMLLESGKKQLDWKDEYKLSAIGKKTSKNYVPLEFNYAYAITCWKAQGSQWHNVLVIEEDFPYNATEHQKFLYTAITRSSSKLVVVK